MYRLFQGGTVRLTTEELSGVHIEMQQSAEQPGCIDRAAAGPAGCARPR